MLLDLAEVTFHVFNAYHSPSPTFWLDRVITNSRTITYNFIDSLYRGRILGFDDVTEFRYGRVTGRGGMKWRERENGERIEEKRGITRNCTVLEDYDIFQRFPRLSHYIGVPNFPWLSLMGML